jgi:hypothetical protein
MSAYNAEQSLLTAPTLNYYASLQDSETSNITQYLVTIPSSGNSSNYSVLMGASGSPVNQSNLMCIDFQYIPKQYVTELAAAVGTTAKNSAYKNYYKNMISFSIQSESLTPALNKSNDNGDRNDNGDGLSNNYVCPVPNLNSEQLKTEWVILCNYTTTNLNVSDFSNPLTVYNAPPKFTIENAYIENDEETPLLFVILYDSNQKEFNTQITEYYENLLFSVTTYVPETASPFGVSKLLKPIVNQSPKYKSKNVILLQMPSPTLPSESPSYDYQTTIPDVYVACRAVLPFIYQTETYYSVGMISDTVLAKNFPQDVACALSITNYSIYNDNYSPNYSIPGTNNSGKIKSDIPGSINAIDKNQSLTFTIQGPNELLLPGLFPESAELYVSKSQSFDIEYLIYSTGDLGVNGGPNGTGSDFFLNANPLINFPSNLVLTDIITDLQRIGIAFTKDNNDNINWTSQRLYFRLKFTLFNNTISTTQYLVLPAPINNTPDTMPDQPTYTNVIIFQAAWQPNYTNVDYALSVEPEEKDDEGNKKFTMEVSITSHRSDFMFSAIPNTPSAPAIFAATVWDANPAVAIASIANQNFLYKSDGILNTVIEILNQYEDVPLFVNVALGIRNPNYILNDKDNTITEELFNDQIYICEAGPSQGTQSTTLAEYTDFRFKPYDPDTNTLPSLTFAVVSPKAIPLDTTALIGVTNNDSTKNTIIQSANVPTFYQVGDKSKLKVKKVDGKQQPAAIIQGMQLYFDEDKSGLVSGSAQPTDTPDAHKFHLLYYYSHVLTDIRLDTNIEVNDEGVVVPTGSQSLLYATSNGANGVAGFTLTGITRNTTIDDFNLNFSDYVKFNNPYNSTANQYVVDNTTPEGNEPPTDDTTKYISVPVFPDTE